MLLFLSGYIISIIQALMTKYEQGYSVLMTKGGFYKMQVSDLSYIKY